MAFYKDFIRMRSGTDGAIWIYENVWCGPIPAQGVRATPHTNTNAIFCCFNAKVGGDLLSHTLPGAVPSAQAGLASGFGKGPGVTPPH